MLDKYDKLILNDLQADAALTTVEISERNNLSQAACWRRIQRLEANGYINKRVALLNADKLGLGTIVFAHIKLSAHGRTHLDQFSKDIQRLSRVIECYCLMGEQDFFAKVVVKDVYDYERFFFDTLSKIEGVSEIKSTMALSQIKFTTELPI
ncbi:Lrp/AsnC family transcriptional regulator [Alteromonas oceanisediminis]|uniref:Lrp/AsnC family transcriptional regulator n=1 Tax=Alteromonas oceanisediminis TaxID=2836180 RepID=UPI001BDB54D1|nr:Lrp/AsnC family transcriptional regulator [Alteromonas oceanisediminis]MBT0586304.1 Lrp/AsnC family transcriptional regulator [Alteromonas oceanisediminis]